MITGNLNQMYYTLHGLHAAYCREWSLKPKNNILIKVKLPLTLDNDLQRRIFQVHFKNISIYLTLYRNTYEIY